MSHFLLDHDMPPGEGPLYEQLIAIIKQGIVSGQLVPGDLLPSESEFCERYGISRSTIRQAAALFSCSGCRTPRAEMQLNTRR